MVDYDSPFVIVAATLATIAVLSIGVYFAVMKLEHVRCDRLSTTASISTKFDYFNGCYVKVNNRFIPRSSWRGEYQGAQDGTGN